MWRAKRRLKTSNFSTDIDTPKSGMLAPVSDETNQREMIEAGVQEIRGTQFFA